MLSPGSRRPSLWLCPWSHSHCAPAVLLPTTIVQIDLVTSIGNPSSITTCIQFFYSKLSNSLLPSVYKNSCRLYIASFPDFPHMHGELENEVSLQTHASCYLFLSRSVIYVQTSCDSPLMNSVNKKVCSSIHDTGSA